MNTIALCPDCASMIGGAFAGPDCEWRHAAPGETCGAADHEEIRPTARANRAQITTDLAWAQAYCAARDHGYGDIAATAQADRCLASATHVAVAGWLAAGDVR